MADHNRNLIKNNNVSQNDFNSTKNLLTLKKEKYKKLSI